MFRSEPEVLARSSSYVYIHMLTHLYCKSLNIHFISFCNVTEELAQTERV